MGRSPRALLSHERVGVAPEAAQLLKQAQSCVGGAEALKEQILDLRIQNRRRPALQDEFTKAGLPG